MRIANLWPAACFLAACAHGAQTSSHRDATPEITAHSQELQRSAAQEHSANSSSGVIEQAHPETGVSQSPEPSPAEARGPGRLEESAATMHTAAPLPQPNAAMAVAIEPSATPPAPVTKPPAASDGMAPMPTHAEQPEKPGAEIARADAELRERVQRALLGSTSLSYTAKHVRVEVAHHDVTLRGEVRTARERSDLEKIVRGLRGVRNLDNQVALISAATAPRSP